MITCEKSMKTLWKLVANFVGTSWELRGNLWELRENVWDLGLVS